MVMLVIPEVEVLFEEGFGEVFEGLLVVFLRAGVFVLDSRAEGQRDDGLDLVDLVSFGVGVD